MLKEILTEEMIQILPSVDTWEDAIKQGSEPLVSREFINAQYVANMIDNVKELGPYIVIAPDVAIAHARPKEDVFKVGLSLLKLDHGVPFSKDGHYASLIFVLAAVDNEQHLHLLSELAAVLKDSGKVNQMKQANSVKQIEQVIQ
ncbi:PTS sugar transporter subunit IIA [Virgibacillus halophilus]|uniref:Ascorbate-specific PTS system EIIA component n=1 Tax=Tigheibacillus halophilus TaxID=361280 RepID=A0ABU5C4Y5_9BACI|nr:PTS sugar transporter subunit IIA [Virgibacillus halophilus]